MIQTYSMVFWKRPFETDINEMTETSYAVLSLLKDYGRSLEPKYLTVRKKSEAKEFSLSKESVRRLLENSINKEGGREFPHLGRAIGFFSSLDDDWSCGIGFTIGASAKHITNAVVIDLPIYYFNNIEEDISGFDILFKDIVAVFSPFWGCVCSNISCKQFGYMLWNGDKPISVHWMNYFSGTTVKSIGNRRFDSLRGLEKLKSGYYLKIQDELFDAENPEHILLQKNINAQLGLQ